MKVLLVSNQHLNAVGVGNPIMLRMISALKNDKRIQQVEFFPFCNQFGSFSKIRNIAKQFDIIHIHFGGLYALVIWFFLIGEKCRKFITFHGTDIHAKALFTTKSKKEKFKICMNQKASFLCICLFDNCGFVAEEMKNYVPSYLYRHIHKKSFIQPLGVDYSTFVPIDKEQAKNHLGIEKTKLILFSDISNTRIKRKDIAEAIVKELGCGYRLLIMSGVKPNEVPYYINACDFALLTSDEEGSPNIIREALSLNKRFFSVEVGDAAKQLSGLKNSAIISRDPTKAVETIKKTLVLPYTDNTRESRKDVLDFNSINKGIVDLYHKKT